MAATILIGSYQKVGLARTFEPGTAVRYIWKLGVDFIASNHEKLNYTVFLVIGCGWTLKSHVFKIVVKRKPYILGN